MSTGQVRGEGRRERERVGERTKLGKRWILLVEDDERIRELMAMLLSSEGFEIVELADGMEALKYLAVADVYQSDLERPDLIIADINMPKFSGLDLLMGMRESPCRPPVMLVTGIKDEEIHREARRLGAVEVVSKPFDVDHFLHAVDESLASPPIEAVVCPQIVTVDVDVEV